MVFNFFLIKPFHDERAGAQRHRIKRRQVARLAWMGEESLLGCLCLGEVTGGSRRLFRRYVDMCRLLGYRFYRGG